MDGIFRATPGDIIFVIFMKLVGFFLLMAGWIIVLAAIALLQATPQTVFALAGFGVELLGLTLAVRSHLIPRVDQHGDSE